MSEKEHSVDFLMIKLLHVYATKIFHQLSHVNLHPGQMPMLDILYRQEGLSQREICSRLCIKPSTDVYKRQDQGCGFFGFFF